MDSTLHNITAEKLTGTWQLIDFGIFNVKDSLLIDADTVTRTQQIEKENKSPIGTITFSEKKITFKDIDDLPHIHCSFFIADGKYLVLKKIITRSTSTIIGLTKENYLIIDDHTYRNVLYFDKAKVVTTTIRRWILKKT